MLESLKRMLGLGAKVDFKELVRQGAVILDVRSKSEFAGGHINGAINISVDTLGANLSRLKNKGKPIITCCASGMRSASARRILKANGYTQVYNGGDWPNLKRRI
jgi:rhodanese-related sulfurtransferase